MVFLSERLGLHLPAHLHHLLCRPAVLCRMPSWQPTCRFCRKPRLHKHLYLDDLLLEWIYQPVQRHLRTSIWNPDHELRKLRSLHLLCLCISKVCESCRPEVHHFVPIRKLHHRHVGRICLRADLRCRELSILQLSECERLHVPELLHHILNRPTVLRHLPGKRSTCGLCRKPCMHQFMHE